MCIYFDISSTLDIISIITDGYKWYLIKVITIIIIIIIKVNYKEKSLVLSTVAVSIAIKVLQYYFLVRITRSITTETFAKLLDSE